MANKKINQLVAKTTIQSTDLFPIGDATTGTLYKKTIADLQAAIGGAVISVNGLVGTVVLDADDILETATPTNKYFTDARARAAISLTTTGSSGASTYSSSTGVLNVPTYTLAGLGGITATFLSGGTGITYNSGTGVISYSGTVYTDSSVRALFSGGTGITYNSSTGAISYSGTVYTDSSIRALFSGTSPITYNSTTGAIGITGANLTESTSSVLTITGGTGALLSAASIQVKQASGSQSGFLSSSDWTTFNNKQSALTNPVTGTGTTNYLTKWTSSSAIGSSSLYDDGNNLLIGTTSATAFNKSVVLNSVSSTAGILFQLNGVDKGFIYSGAGDLYIGSNSNTVQLYTNGAERLRITSAGNVGIGTTSPSTPLEVNGNIRSTSSGSSYFLANRANSTSQAGFQWQTNGTTNWYNYTEDSTNTLFWYGNGAYRMALTSAGNVGIGTTSPSTLLHVYGTGSGAGTLKIQTASGNDVNLRLQDQSREYYVGTSGGTYYIYDNTAGANRLNITSGGNHLIGTTTDNGERLYVSGSIRATGTITANSDITLKKNLAKIENALEKVEQINGYTYEFKADDSKRHAGVIAQEIEGVLPEIVNKGNDGLLGVEYGNISALLIEAIKEQQKKIQELEVKLIALGQ